MSLITCPIVDSRRKKNRKFISTVPLKLTPANTGSYAELMVTDRLTDTELCDTCVEQYLHQFFEPPSKTFLGCPAKYDFHSIDTFIKPFSISTH